MSFVVEITLTQEEMRMGAQCGSDRHWDSLHHHRRDKHGCDGKDGLTMHIEGACGEIAVARCYNRHWSAHVGSFKGADVGANCQVRTRSLHKYDLIIRDDDNDDHYYVLVTGIAPDFLVHGHIQGRDGKQEQWRKGHGGREPAFFVPKDDLVPPPGGKLFVVEVAA